MATFYLSRTELESLLDERDGVRAFGPVRTDRGSWVASTRETLDVDALSQPRSAQSPKGFFLPASESLGRYGTASGADPAPSSGSENNIIVLVGVRACELPRRDYLDRVMCEGPFVDPLYRDHRERLLMVSCDCVSCTDTCFCTEVGGLPHATSGFDVNLSPQGDGFLVETDTDRGRAWLVDKVDGLLPAVESQVADRDQRRREMADRVRQQNRVFSIQASDERAPALPDDADDAWQRFAADCVECGACTHICPTCHCFYLYDQVLGAEAFERVRTWDSCLFASYHRMAGGPATKLTPRPRLASRLANRVLHKFDYSPRQYGRLGCVGCGRCVEACLGEIDIRDVVHVLGKPGKKEPAK